MDLDSGAGGAGAGLEGSQRVTAVLRPQTQAVPAGFHDQAAA
jgi:hypothetical protein